MATNDSSFTYEITGQITLTDLMYDWGRQNAPGVPDRLFDPVTGYIAGTMLVLLNGRSVKSDDPKTTMVYPGDVIYITPILIGG